MRTQTTTDGTDVGLVKKTSESFCTSMFLLFILLPSVFFPFTLAPCGFLRIIKR